jgi:hypothetical protein
VSAALEAAVRQALAGNLWLDNEEDGTKIEDAVMRIAGAQLKAIAIAIAINDPGTHQSGWCMSGGLTKDEAILAIGGIATLLSSAPSLIAQSREARRESEHEEAVS